jgi:hypothetical protein
MGATNLTENKNYLSPVSFKVTIDSQEFANIEYFCISATLPGITLPEVAVPFKGSQNFVAGDRIDYPNFDMRFIITENMENYTELFNWIRENATSDRFKKKDILLHIASSHNNIVKQVRYVDAFPVTVGTIEFNSQNLDIEYITADASFRYTYLEFVK